MAARLTVLACLLGACAVAETSGDAVHRADAGSVKPRADAGVSDTASFADAPAAPDVDAAPKTLPLVAQVTPSLLTVSRGAWGTLTITLAGPAPAQGALVTIESDDAAGATFTLAASVTVPAGATTARVAVSGVAAGGPLAVRAYTGQSAAQSAMVRVVPALLNLSPPRLDLLAATTATVTVTLEAAPAAPVDVVLASGDAGVASVPATATIPAGSATGTFTVTGRDALGVVTVSAAIGDRAVTSDVRVFGLLMSEILYQTSGSDGGWEWIELYNAAAVPVDTSGMKLQVANTAGPYVNALALPAQAVPAHGCVVVGGPMTGATNYTPATLAYYVAVPFNPNLGNAGGSSTTDPGDGIQLVAASGKVLDNVIYGNNNSDRLTDENGDVPAAPDVGRAAVGKTLERTSAAASGTWIIQATPNPGNCSAVGQ